MLCMKYFSSCYCDLCYILAALSAQAMLCLPIWRVKMAVLPVMVRFVSRTLMMLQGPSVSFAPLLTLTFVKIPSSAVMLLIGISPYSIKYCKVLCIICTVLTVVTLLKEGSYYACELIISPVVTNEVIVHHEGQLRAPAQLLADSVQRSSYNCRGDPLDALDY